MFLVSCFESAPLGKPLGKQTSAAFKFESRAITLGSSELVDAKCDQIVGWSRLVAWIRYVRCNQH